jgi:hypothetical protein
MLGESRDVGWEAVGEAGLQDAGIMPMTMR